MRKRLPVNPNILKWARESIGLTISDVARKTKQKQENIEKWESGEECPTYPQLEKLANDIYQRPIAIFFFPEIPSEETTKTAFRTLPSAISTRLPHEIFTLYRKAKVFQINLEELYDGEKPIRNNLIDYYHNIKQDNHSLISSKLRAFLDCPIEEQFSWKSHSFAFDKWRELLENKGIFIFKDAFHNDDFSGFCLYHDKYPVIYINNTLSISRQIFTLFHELNHLFRHLGGIDFNNINITDSLSGIYNKYEINCNIFAGEFLVPLESFNAHKLPPQENNINLLSNLFSVSREVILRKYLDLGDINDSYYHEMVNKWAKELSLIKKKRKGGNYYYTHIIYLGKKYINLAFNKYYQRKYSIDTLANYLNIKAKYISKFEAYK
jgi:Zn-dependent peptidase ImmA (M78 family)